MILTLFIPLTFVAFLLMALGFYGDFKPAAIATGAILLLITGIFIGSEGLEYRTGEQTTYDKIENFAYQNYSVNGQNESAIKVEEKNITGNTTTLQQHQQINSNLNTFLSIGLIIAGLALFIRLLFNFLPEAQK